MKNAHEFPGLYDDLFAFANAGYVMVDTGMPWVQFPVALTKYEYVSPDPSYYWMKGVSKSWHVTGRGPLDPKVRQVHAKQVLESFELPTKLHLGDIEVFPSPYPEEPYDCVVVLVDDEKLFDLNQQLAVLPGVQTYIPYKPHLTLGYFKDGYADVVVSKARENLRAYVEVQGYDFGRMKP